MLITVLALSVSYPDTIPLCTSVYSHLIISYSNIPITVVLTLVFLSLPAHTGHIYSNTCFIHSHFYNSDLVLSCTQLKLYEYVTSSSTRLHIKHPCRIKSHNVS